MSSPSTLSHLIHPLSSIHYRQAPPAPIPVPLVSQCRRLSLLGGESGGERCNRQISSCLVDNCCCCCSTPSFLLSCQQHLAALFCLFLLWVKTEKFAPKLVDGSIRHRFAAAAGEYSTAPLARTHSQTQDSRIRNSEGGISVCMCVCGCEGPLGASSFSHRHTHRLTCPHRLSDWILCVFSLSHFVVVATVLRIVLLSLPFVFLLHRPEYPLLLAYSGGEEECAVSCSE